MRNRKIKFVNVVLENEAATSHFCFIGATGSGKTVCIRLLIQGVLYDKETNRVSRALVYDAKRDSLPVLHGIVGPDNYDEQGDEHKVVTLNPFDDRSCAWDMAKDVTTPGHAQQMATTLIPSDQNASQPYFANSARHLLQGVLTVFIRTKKWWDLRDVMYTLKDAKRLCAVLESDEKTAPLVNLYFSVQDTSNNIMSELASRLGQYEIIAALWHKTKRKISLNDWLSGPREYILVLGNDHTNRAALDAINQVIFKRVSELILDQPDNRNRRTWIILDEFVRAGRLNGMVELATEGRSKGACIVLGFQDINGLRAVYGKEVAEEIVGQCSSMAVLRLQSPDTAEWASKLFGSREDRETKESSSTAVDQKDKSIRDKTMTQSRDIVTRDAILASEFMYLRPTNPRNGLYGYIYSPFVVPKVDASSTRVTPPYKSQQTPEQTGDARGAQGIIKRHLNGEELFGKLGSDNKRQGGLLWNERKELGVQFRKNIDDQYLDDWAREDYKRLALMSVFQEAEINKIRVETQKREADIRKLAEVAFLNGWLTVEQIKMFLRLNTQEKRAFSRVLSDLKKNRLFLGDSPTPEDTRALDDCSNEEREAFCSIVELVSSQPVDSAKPNVISETEIERKRLERDKKEKEIRELAELSFLKGWPNVAQVGKINRFTPQEKAAFFQALGELKRTKLFLGSSPTPEVEKAFHECSNEEREAFSEIVELLNSHLTKPSNQKNPTPEEVMAAIQEEAVRRKSAR